MVKNNDLNKYLDVAAKFPKYSINNTMLIYAQNPNATMLQSYSDWKVSGRQVESGEKAITLLKAEFKREEVPRLDPNTKQPVLNDKGEPIMDMKNIRTGYTKASVFDISQTKGNELQSLRESIREDFRTTPRSAEIYQALYNRFDQHQAVAQSVRLPGNPDFKNQNEFKQLLENYAKHQLQRINPNDPMLEQKAEAAKVIVAKHYDLAEQGYQSDLSSWSKDAGTIRKSLEDIQRVSGNIIREVDHLNQERIQQLAKSQPLNKSEERLAFLAAAYENSYNLRQQFMRNPDSFKNDPADDMKVLIVYANRMEKQKPIDQKLEDAFTKVRDEMDRKFDQPGIEQTGRWQMIDYISQYERAGGLQQAALDAKNERAADRADAGQSPKSKSDELER